MECKECGYVMRLVTEFVVKKQIEKYGILEIFFDHKKLYQCDKCKRIDVSSNGIQEENLKSLKKMEEAFNK